MGFVVSRWGWTKPLNRGNIQNEQEAPHFHPNREHQQCTTRRCHDTFLRRRKFANRPLSAAWFLLPVAISCRDSDTRCPVADRLIKSSIVVMRRSPSPPRRRSFSSSTHLDNKVEVHINAPGSIALPGATSLYWEKILHE